MNKRIILMLGHQSKVGKDTVADELVKRSGFKKIAFADKLKEVCADLFFVPLVEFYNESLKNEEVERYGITRRRILQIVGQAMFSVDKCVWVNHVIQKLNYLDKIVITDFRFPHEIDKMKEFAAKHNYELISIKIHREGISDFSGKNDPSELSLIEYPWDYHVHNNGSIEDLYHKVNIIVSDKRLFPVLQKEW